MELYIEADVNMTDHNVDDNCLRILPRKKIQGRKYSPVAHVTVKNKGKTLGTMQIEMSKTGEIRTIRLEEIETEETGPG